MQPDLSAVYGIHPWDYERLTPRELEGYLDHYTDMKRGSAHGSG